MDELIIHPQTLAQLNAYIQAPTQAVLLVGSSGSGKLTIAKKLTEATMELSPGNFDTHSYTLHITSDEGKAIGVESIRELEHFLSLKVPGQRTFNRVVIIEDSHLLTLEAQNALLKTLEEPPVGTLIILTASHGRALLPTIHSRLQAISIHRPSQEALREFFHGSGFNDADISQATAMGGGLPGLMQALLSDEQHPLKAAAEEARQLLSQPLFERLKSVDTLSKQRVLASDTVDMLQQMAHVSLQKVTGQAAERWQKMLTASYEAAGALQASAQLKLVLTNMVLQF